MAKAAKKSINNTDKAVTPTQNRIVELGRALFAAKATKDRLEDELKAINETIKTLATVDLAQAMTDAEMEKTTLAGLGTIYMSDEIYVSVATDDRPTLYEWMRANGYEDMIQDYVFPQTLKAFAKEQAHANLPLPEVVKMTTVPTAKTRSTSK